MPKERFESRKLTGSIRITCKFENQPARIWETTKEAVVASILQIVREHSDAGYIMTLRQLHYQLVKRNEIVNHVSAYKKLGDILDDCRYCGLVDWKAIEDRGRKPYLLYHAASAAEAMEDIIGAFRLDRQEGQLNHVEVWTEKDALSGIFKRTTEKYHVQLVVNKGYSSSSAIYEAYERSSKAIKEGKKVTILYFGDHDPSGLDMIRDIRERLLFFLSKGTKLPRRYRDQMEDWWDDQDYTIHDLVDQFGSPENILKLLEQEDDKLSEDFQSYKMQWFLTEKEIFRVVGIGLTFEQIEYFDLPPNPAKLTDSRADKYIEKFGNISWEVDALDHEQLTDILEAHIQKEIDIELYESVVGREAAYIEKLEELRDTFNNEEDEDDTE